MSFGDLAREAYLGTLSDAGLKNGADIEAGVWEQSAGHHKQARTRMGYTDRYSCAAVST